MNGSGMGSAVEHLKHLEIPGQGSGETGRAESIRGRNEDFAAGYSLGLIGGVRSWVSNAIQLVPDNPRSCANHGRLCLIR